MAVSLKTNALRLLDGAKVSYRTLSYAWEEGLFDGELVAGKIDMDPSAVFKTLVIKGERKGYAVFVIPVNKELDLKAAATLMQDKKADLIHVNDLLALTGYIRGGCSPVGMKKLYPTYIDASALSHSEIAVSAGVRGLQMVLYPRALIDYLHAHTGRLIKE